jgi:hypothetical protein
MPQAEGFLRVGVVLDERDVRRWQVAAVSEVERLGSCELTVITSGPDGSAGTRRFTGAPFTRLREAVRHSLYRLYEYADRRWFGRDDDALGSESIHRGDGDVGNRVHLKGDWSSDSHIAAIAALDLDVVLCLAPQVPADRLAGCARFGAWSLYAGAMRVGNGEGQLFWEVYDGDLAAPITLRAHTSTEGERMIYRSFVRSDQASLHRTRRAGCGRATHLPARRLRDLRDRGWPFITSSPVYAERCPTPDPRRSSPSNATMLRFLWRTFRLVLSRRLAQWLGERQWFLAYRRIGPEPDADGDSAPLTTIMPPAGRFYADPFLFQRDGRRFIFFEDWEWSAGSAVICYVEIDERGHHGAPRLALRQDCHLSYPFVFAEGDSVYMVPETGGRRTVELYRAVRFPFEWTLERVLLEDVSACDATLLRHEGKWWLFVAIDVDGGVPLDELFIFSSDSLQGEWEPHPMNPVVSDVRSARPAGRIFSQNGHLIRPAQDCSQAYGWRIVFNRIDALSATDYREQAVSAIEPAPETGNLRTHSYDSDGTYEILDGYRMRPRVSATVAGMSRAHRPPGWLRIDLESPGRERSPLSAPLGGIFGIWGVRDVAVALGDSDSERLFGPVLSALAAGI